MPVKTAFPNPAGMLMKPFSIKKKTSSGGKVNMTCTLICVTVRYKTAGWEF